MLVVAGYLLLSAGLLLSGLSFVNFLLTEGPLVGGVTVEMLAVSVTLQGIVLGLGVAGIGLAVLRLRRLRLAEGGRLEAASGTGWAFGLGALVGAAVIGGGAYWFLGVWEEAGSVSPEPARVDSPAVEAPGPDSAEGDNMVPQADTVLP